MWHTDRPPVKQVKEENLSLDFTNFCAHHSRDEVQQKVASMSIKNLEELVKSLMKPKEMIENKEALIDMLAEYYPEKNSQFLHNLCEYATKYGNQSRIFYSTYFKDYQEMYEAFFSPRVFQLFLEKMISAGKKSLDIAKELRVGFFSIFYEVEPRDFTSDVKTPYGSTASIKDSFTRSLSLAEHKASHVQLRFNYYLCSAVFSFDMQGLVHIEVFCNCPPDFTVLRVNRTEKKLEKDSPGDMKYVYPQTIQIPLISFDLKTEFHAAISKKPKPPSSEQAIELWNIFNFKYGSQLPRYLEFCCWVKHFDSEKLYSMFLKNCHFFVNGSMYILHLPMLSGPQIQFIDSMIVNGYKFGPSLRSGLFGESCDFDFPFKFLENRLLGIPIGDEGQLEAVLEPILERSMEKHGCYEILLYELLNISSAKQILVSFGHISNDSLELKLPRLIYETYNYIMKATHTKLKEGKPHHTFTFRYRKKVQNTYESLSFPLQVDDQYAHYLETVNSIINNSVPPTSSYCSLM